MNALLSRIDWVALLGSVTTVVAFATFAAIVVWAWSARRKAAFDAAARAPFALPDDEQPARDQA
jgi:cbb3-type cytochrome oxidase subunit 3